MCVAAKVAGWFFVSEKKRQERSCLVALSFEIEVEGRSPYTEIQEVDLVSHDPRYYIEDLDEGENSTKGT